MKLLDISIGSLVTHLSHDLGIGLVTEVRIDIPTGAYKCICTRMYKKSKVVKKCPLQYLHLCYIISNIQQEKQNVFVLTG